MVTQEDHAAYETIRLDDTNAMRAHSRASVSSQLPVIGKNVGDLALLQTTFGGHLAKGAQVTPGMA